MIRTGDQRWHGCFVRALSGAMKRPDPDADHWRGRSDEELIAAVQLCREACYGRDAVRGRIARVLEVATDLD